MIFVFCVMKLHNTDLWEGPNHAISIVFLSTTYLGTFKTVPTAKGSKLVFLVYSAGLTLVLSELVILMQGHGKWDFVCNIIGWSEDRILC